MRVRRKKKTFCTCIRAIVRIRFGARAFLWIYARLTSFVAFARSRPRLLTMPPRSHTTHNRQHSAHWRERARVCAMLRVSNVSHTQQGARRVLFCAAAAFHTARLPVCVRLLSLGALCVEYICCGRAAVRSTLRQM